MPVNNLSTTNINIPMTRTFVQKKIRIPKTMRFVAINSEEGRRIKRTYYVEDSFSGLFIQRNGTAHKRSIRRFEREIQQREQQLQTSTTDPLQQQYKKLKKETKASIKIDKYKTNKHKSLKGLKVRDYVHKIPSSLKLNITTITLNDIKNQLNRIVHIHKHKLINGKYRLFVKDNNKNLTLSTPFISNWRHLVNMMMSNHLRPAAAAYEDNTFTIDQIWVSRIRTPQNLMGSSVNKTVTKAHDKWHIVNPTSRYNCVYQSIAVCRNFTNNKDFLEPTTIGKNVRIKSGIKLKKEVNPTNDNYANFTSIQQACDYTRYPINLYNDTFDLIKTFKPARPLGRYRLMVKEYNIQKVGDHCKALIPKDLILKKYPKLVIKSFDDEDEKEPMDTPILGRKYFHKYNEKIAAWDIETLLNMARNHTSYACSLAWYTYEYGESIIKMVNKRRKYKGKWIYEKKPQETKTIKKRIPNEMQFWGMECLQEMTKFIHDNKDIFNGYTLYAHNGGKYDLPLAIKKAFIESDEFLIEGKGCVELNNAWIGFTLRSKTDRKFRIFFRDSYKLLPMSLAKLTKELGVKHQKLTETVNHDEVTLDNYNDIPELKKYLSHDVLGLLEVVTVFGENVYNELGIDITKCFTGASLSKMNFFKNYYNISTMVYKLTDSNDKFIRDSYFGGRVECFKYGKIGKSYYYDFTSLYPDVGRNHLPYGKPETVKLNLVNKLPSDFFGFVECVVKTKNNSNCIPMHAMYNDDRLIFPIFENWTKINVFSEELDYEQYDYQFITGVKFKKAKFKKKFFEDGFYKKYESKEEGNTSMAQAYKIIINSGYGFWGLKTKNRDGLIICEKDSNAYVEYLNNDKLLSIHENNDYVFCRVLKDLNVKDYNVSVAAAISSYARIKMHSLLTDIKKAGGHIAYCDTDSVICDINLNDYPEIKEKYQWDGDGSELGCLKNECDDEIKKLIDKKVIPNATKNEKKRLFNKLSMLENGNFSFDDGIITGCKQYALTKTINIMDKDYTIEIVKCKGYSQKDDKLTFSDMETINKGELFTQLQTQFRCPKSNYVSDTNDININSKIVPKRFRKCYTKGIIKNNNITPLVI